VAIGSHPLLSPGHVGSKGIVWAPDSPCLSPVTSDRDRLLLLLTPDGILDAVAYRHKMSAFAARRIAVDERNPPRNA